MKTIKLEFNINEVNTIMRSLGNMPFNQVNELINKISAQAKPQIDEKKPDENAQP